MSAELAKVDHEVDLDPEGLVQDEVGPEGSAADAEASFEGPSRGHVEGGKRGNPNVRSL